MKEFIIKNGILEYYEGKSENVIIPDGVTAIGEYAFKGCEDLQSVTMPDSITNIEKGAFYNCKNLQCVTVSENLKIIGAWAFSCCNRLEYIKIPDGVFRIGEGAFFYCSNLQTVSVPNGVTEIGFHVFTGCCQLKTLTIPDSVTNIEYAAFHGCHCLQSVSIGNGITEIHKDAFPDEMNVRKWILAPDSTKEEPCKMLLDLFGTSNLALSFLLGTMETNAILRKKLQNHIIHKPFREYFIPVLIEKGEYEAMAKMLSLVKKMPVEELDFYIEKAKNAPEFLVMLIEYKKQLYPPELLDKMEEIQMEKDFGLREKTLTDYKKIFSVKKENGVYLITKYKGMDTDVTIPSHIRGVPVQCGKAAFKDNQQMQNVYMEDGLTVIEDQLFFSCKNLKKLTIPASVMHIGENVFHLCSELIIFAPANSYAATYAEQNDIRFNPI